MKDFEKWNPEELSEKLTALYKNESKDLLVCFLKDTDTAYVNKNAIDPALLEQCREECGVSLALAVASSAEMTELFCISRNQNIRALEFMDFITEEYGSCNGNEKSAKGEISTMLLKLQQGENCDLEMFFLETSLAYFSESEIVYPWEYAVEKEQEIKSWPLYVKKEIPWAVVKSVDIAGAGKKIKVRTLENDTGVELTASDDVYIMIGMEGEVYDISRPIFENTYTMGGDALNIFEKMMKYIPAAEILETGDYVAIDTMASLCYPKKGNGIYVSRLTGRTKVFRQKGSGEYFIGKEGDYLVSRRDNLSDIYIIQGDIFENSYEKLSGEG